MCNENEAALSGNGSRPGFAHPKANDWLNRMVIVGVAQRRPKLTE